MLPAQETYEMADKKGIESSKISKKCKEWFIVDEAECDELTEMDKLFEESDGSVVSNLFDDSDEVDQGNSLELLNQQLLQESNVQLADLKRKYLSPEKDSVLALSPQLESVRISPHPKNSRRRLFADSGIENEAEDSIGVTQVESESPDCQIIDDGARVCKELLQSKNRRAICLAKFKDSFGVSFTELTRVFRSDKTCCNSWVICVLAVNEELVESSKTLLKLHCEFCQILVPTLGPVVTALYLCEFKCSKNRETVTKLFCQLLNVQEMQLMCNPPKHKSVVVALFFFKQSMSSVSFKFGAFPEWLAKQTVVSFQQEAEAFQLSRMVQWAYDHNYVEESVIAYHYACIANEDSNAAAWLNCNNQLKYVHDCSKMVRYYIRQEMREMSVSEWIYKCCDKVKDTSDEWKTIAKLLRYQEVNMVAFLCALRLMFKKVPKRNTIVFSGKPNSGKSYFSYSLMSFLEGKVVSHMNSKSQFWLQPLTDAKFGLIDDATDACWQFMDVYMRSALDGNEISVDCKHKNAMQVKLPSLFITTNVPVDKEVQYSYLHSRLQVFYFNREMPLDSSGNPVYEINDKTWASFFIRLEKQLDLTRPEDGKPDRAFRCSAGEPAGII